MKTNEIYSALSITKNVKAKAVKYVAISIAAIVVILILMALWKWIEKKVRNRRVVNSANSEIDRSKLTLTDAQFHLLASKLYTALKGVFVQPKAAYEVFEALNTRSDVMQLSVIYGVRESWTMARWIQKKLTRNQVLRINEILTSKNIDLSFFSGEPKKIEQNERKQKPCKRRCRH